MRRPWPPLFFSRQVAISADIWENNPYDMPEETKSDILLREIQRAIAPLIDAAVRDGITYPQFSQALKARFLDAAQQELQRQGKKLTDSAISVLSGVHRKDVRAISHSERELPKPLSLASQLYTRWLASPETTDGTGAPRALPRTGAAPSFESLAASVSSDVHPRTLVEELARLKLVVIDGEFIHPQKTSFVPSEGYAEMAAFMAANVGDHAAAASTNLAGQAPPFLEQSVFADGLTEESIELLMVLARQGWKRMFDDTVALATHRVQRDLGLNGDRRMRLGVYFYSEAQASVASNDSTAGETEP